MRKTFSNDLVRRQLLRKLKKENCFWSYDVSKMKSISDNSLIEHVLLYLELDRVAPQGAMFRPYNILYAWYYFGAKRPEAYVKSIETRHINRLISAWLRTNACIWRYIARYSRVYKSQTPGSVGHQGYYLHPITFCKLCKNVKRPKFPTGTFGRFVDNV